MAAGRRLARARQRSRLSPRPGSRWRARVTSRPSSYQRRHRHGTSGGQFILARRSAVADSYIKRVYYLYKTGGKSHKCAAVVLLCTNLMLNRERARARYSLNPSAVAAVVACLRRRCIHILACVWIRVRAPVPSTNNNSAMAAHRTQDECVFSIII